MTTRSVTRMPLPIPQKSTASYFYKYSGPANLGWLKDFLHNREIYLPNLSQLNDGNDGLPRLAMFLAFSRGRKRKPFSGGTGIFLAPWREQTIDGCCRS